MQHNIVLRYSVVNMMAISWINCRKAGHLESLPRKFIHLQEEWVSYWRFWLIDG